MNLRRMMTSAGVTLAAVVALAAPAAAHTPVLLDQSDRVPISAPLVVDGTDGVSFFGVIPRPYDVRSAQFVMRAGQQVTVQVAIPNRAPENTLAVEDLPQVVVIAPDLSYTVLQPVMRVPIHEPDLNLDLLLLRGYTASAQAGTYSIVVTSKAKSRFVVVTGNVEAFHGLKRGKPATEDQIQDWYTTAP